MKVQQINITKQAAFRADVDTKDPLTGEYKDPLMHWPLRGAAFTNEIGEALRPLIGSYATLSWVPALLYIGADIYDKYKNDQTEYSPSSHRCLKQALFQGMASIFLPLVAVKAGQDIFSLLGYLTQDRISINAKEKIDKLAKEFVANGNLRAYRNKNEECINKFKDIVSNNMDYHKNKKRGLNVIKNLFLILEEKLMNNFVNKKQKNIDSYAEETILNVIDMKEKLYNSQKDFLNTKYYKYYKMLLDKGQTQNVAVKNVLNKFLNNKGINGRIIKTAGGFMALSLAIKPIDNFVEKILIGKIVGPGLDKKNG